MKKILLPAFVLSLFIANAQTFVSTSPENKNVIVEEFTGISCVWCPAGHLIGQQMHDQNPNDVFLINIHTGGYATPQGPGTDFNTNFGAAIATQSNLAGYPAGTVNRHQFTMTQNGGTAMSRGDWPAAGTQILGQPSPVNVGVQASVDMATNMLTVDVEVYYTGTQTGLSSNKLNIAIVQNNIEGPQTGGASNNPGSMLPNGNYNHMHMLRHMLTGQWGESITDISQGAFYSDQFTWNMPANINGVLLDPTNIAVIAFVAEGNQEILSGTEVYPSLVFANAYDAYLVSATAKDNICSDVAKDIEVLIKNYGNLPLTTLDIEYSVNGGATYTFPWVGNLASGQSTVVTLSNYTYVPSLTNNLSVSVSNPNGNTDQNTSNDNTSTTFTNHSQGGIVTGISGGNATIDVTTDQYANETSWELLDDNGNVVVASGTLTNSSAQPTVNVMLNAGDCYTFNMYDSYGDGIYPSAGGGFEVKDVAGNIIVSNWSFTSSEDKTPFEVTGSSPCSGFSTTAPSTTAATCTQQNGSATIQATGGTMPYNYSWSNGQSNPTIAGLAGGAYSCTVTDANGCSSTDIAGVGIDNSNSPTAGPVSSVNVTCNGGADGETTISGLTGGTPPYTYLWNDPLSQTTQTAIGLSAGVYLLEYTDANGCGGYESVVITEPMALISTTTIVDASGAGFNDGQISLTTGGGTGTYSYLWSNGQTTATATNLSSGTYTCTITDSNGCTETVSVNVSAGSATGTVEINAQLLIYPNPAKDVLTIKGDYKSVEIYDIYGKLVLSSDAKSVINISNLANGVYLANIKTENGIIINKVTISK